VPFDMYISHNDSQSTTSGGHEISAHCKHGQYTLFLNE
jgi:hypothetical protein